MCMRSSLSLLYSNTSPQINRSNDASYRIVINDKVYYCESNEYDISSYTEDLNVKIMAISNNLEIADSMYERSDLLNGFTRGFLTTFNNGINGKLFDIEKTEEGYIVSVRSNGRRCVFGIALKEGLDLKNHAGLKIVFKVIQADHTCGFL